MHVYQNNSIFALKQRVLSCGGVYVWEHVCVAGGTLLGTCVLAEVNQRKLKVTKDKMSRLVQK